MNNDIDYIGLSPESNNKIEIIKNIGDSFLNGKKQLEDIIIPDNIKITIIDDIIDKIKNFDFNNNNYYKKYTGNYYIYIISINKIDNDLRIIIIRRDYTLLFNWSMNSYIYKYNDDLSKAYNEKFNL